VSETRAETVPDEAPAVGGERSTLREYYEAILVAVIFALFVRTFVFQAFKIPSGSMEDNLLVGDHILVDKITYGLHSGRVWDKLLPYREPARGDVVVFKWPEDPARDFIKRCIGVGDDAVEVRDTAVFVNGKPRREEPPVFFKDHGPAASLSGRMMIPEGRDDMAERRVPPGRLFMMGDNRDRSYDSRFWGPVRNDYVKGRALLVYWSFDSPPQGTTPPTPRETIGRLVDVVVHFFSKTRWSRTFRVIH
jgi:signal peptidase I